MNILKEAIQQLASVKGCKFISVTYKAKGTGELARHRLLLGVNLERVYKRDLSFYRHKLGWLTRGIENATEEGKAILLIRKQACEELIASLSESLTVGIGNNSAYTCKDTYAHLVPGIKLHVENGQLHLNGFTRSKVVLEAGIYKETKSAQKTIEKDKLRKHGKMGKFRQFVLDSGNLQTVRVNGNTLEIA